MNKQIKKQVLSLAITAIGLSPVFTYAANHVSINSQPGTSTVTPEAGSAPAESMQGMDHSKMDMSGADEGKKEMPAMDHSKMNMQGMDHSKMDMSGAGEGKKEMPSMDHSKMNMQGMDHRKMDMSGAGEGKKDMPAMDHSKMNMQGMDHSKMDMSGAGEGKKDMPAMDHSKMNMQGMDHGSMQMQGGSAPADARDPHGYSGGYALDSGAYSLGPQNRLRMSDEHNFASVLFDRFEYVKSGSSEGLAYEAQAWFGGTYDRAVLKAEGEIESGKLKEAQTELLWGHAVSTFWDTQLGVRFDHGEGQKRQWLAFGVQGLSPYWFDIDATAYVGSGGRTALSLSAEYELLITQKLVLQPRVEVNFYGKKDEAREIGSGLSDGTAGLRLKYEVSRQFVPYIGVEWTGKFGQTANFARSAGESTRETKFVAGVSFRF